MRVLRRLQTPIQIAFGVIAIGFLVYFVVQNWSDLSGEIAKINAGWLLGALACAFLATICFMFNWKSIIHAFGYDLSVRRASEITFIAQIGKYIPGRVWPMVAASRMGAESGLPVASVAVTMFMQVGIQLVTATVTAVGALFLLPQLAHDYWWLIVGVLVIGLIALWPPVMRRILALLFTVIRRKDELPDLRGRHLGASILWSLAGWVAFGFHQWLLFSGVSSFSWSLLIPSIAGYALSWEIGFLAILTPAGAGVREGILVLLLSGIYGAAAVFGVALVSRIELIVVDVVLFAIAMVLRRLDRPRREAAAQSQPVLD